jgi:hypothetical protein
MTPMTTSGVVTRFCVCVVDGDGLPVPGLQLGARFKYDTEPASWDWATTDGHGQATFCDKHPEPPREVSFYVGDAFCDTFPVVDGSTVVLEM